MPDDDNTEGRFAIPPSMHPMAFTVRRQVGVRTRVMFEKMLERAESRTDAAYSKAMDDWLNSRCGTIVLRDDLCMPFKGFFVDRGLPFSPELDWFNAFTDLDAAQCRHVD